MNFYHRWIDFPQSNPIVPAPVKALASCAALSFLRRKQLSEPENRPALGRSAKRTDGNIEHRCDPHIRGIRSLHPPGLSVPWPAIEAARAARAPLQALEHDLSRRIHSRTIHRHSPRRDCCWFGRPPHRAPPDPHRLIRWSRRSTHRAPSNANRRIWYGPRLHPQPWRILRGWKDIRVRVRLLGIEREAREIFMIRTRRWWRREGKSGRDRNGLRIGVA